MRSGRAKKFEFVLRPYIKAKEIIAEARSARDRGERISGVLVDELIDVAERKVTDKAREHEVWHMAVTLRPPGQSENAPRSVRRRKVRAAKLIADGLWVDLRRGKYDPIRQLRVGTPDADHVSCLPAGPTLAFAAGLAGVGSPRAPGSPRQRCGRCTGLDGVLCALRGGRSTQRPLRAVDDGQGADLCLRDGHILLARGGEEAGGGCSISDARGGQLPATSHGM